MHDDIGGDWHVNNLTHHRMGIGRRRVSAQVATSTDDDDGDDGMIYLIIHNDDINQTP